MGDGGQGLVSGFVEPVRLTGDRWVTLEPLTREHIPEIAAVAHDGELGASVVHLTRRRRRPPSSGCEMRLAAQKPDTGLTLRGAGPRRHA